MVGRDSLQLGLWRVTADPVEEAPTSHFHFFK